MTQYLLSSRASAWLSSQHEDVTQFIFTCKGDSTNTTASGFYHHLLTLFRKAVLEEDEKFEYSCQLVSRPTFTKEKCFAQLEGKFRTAKYTFADGTVWYEGLQCCIYEEDIKFLMAFYWDFECQVPVTDMLWTEDETEAMGVKA